MRSSEPPAAPGLMRNIMSRQEATPSKQVCQENRLKVGLGWGREGRALRACHGLHLQPQSPGPSPSHASPLVSEDTGHFSTHRKLGAEAHSRLRQDRSTAA